MDMTSQELAEFLSGCSLEFKERESKRGFGMVIPDWKTQLNGFIDHVVNAWAIEEYGRAELKHGEPCAKLQENLGDEPCEPA